MLICFEKRQETKRYIYELTLVMGRSAQATVLSYRKIPHVSRLYFYILK